jgi:hypothetical protein
MGGIGQYRLNWPKILPIFSRFALFAPICERWAYFLAPELAEEVATKKLP